MHRVNGSQESLPSGHYQATRRSTQPNLFPLSPDTNTQRSRERSGSPLRHSITASPHSEDGSPLPDRYDQSSWGDQYGHYSEEPTSPTLGALARVANSIVSSLKSPPLKPTDDEIEAQAIRDREYSRREAERILTREAEERRIMEEKILAMRSNGRNGSQTSLQLPSAPDTTFTAGSPGREDSPGWWKAAKHRITPTRELTPAQQIIQETKVKDKDVKKGKGREPRTPTKKMSDPSILHLDLPRDGQYRQDSTSPTRERPSTATDRGTSPNSKSMKDGDNPPLYAKFTPGGTLDIPETVLTLARRFEKLERWTVGHVRALEDRVGDVEKWLVDKEEARQTSDDAREQDAAESKRVLDEIKARGDELKKLADETSRKSQQTTREVRQTVKTEVENAVMNIRLPSSHAEVTKSDLHRINSEVSTVKEGLAELKTKMSEFGKLSPNATGKAAERTVSPAPVVSHSTGGLSSTPSRTRLPYPSGDYASGDGITPPSSPPPMNGTGRAHLVSSPTSIPLPSSASLHNSTSNAALNSGRQQSSSSYNSSLPIPGNQAPRPDSTSPTPRNRKRYTVALGGSLSSPLEQLAQEFEDANKDAEPAPLAHDDSPMGIKLIGSTFSRDSPSPSHGREETIGGTPIDLARVQSLSPQGSLSTASKRGQDVSPSSSRIRAQSAYGAPAGWGSMSKNIADTPPLRPRRRSGDMSGQGEFGAIGAKGTATGSANKFVDPLILRKKEKEPVGPPRLAVPRGKTSFGDLLAFFDGEKPHSAV